jgi:hypothetical protein
VTILDICKQLGRLDDDAVIYARRVNGQFAPESEAVVHALLEEDLSVPTQDVAPTLSTGMAYCLEVFLAKEASDVWSNWRNGCQPSPFQLAEAICYKANNDAWGPPNFPV